MGYWNNNTCYAYYLQPQTNSAPIPPNVSASFPSIGGTPFYFQANFTTQPVDTYVIAGTVTGAGGSHPEIATIDPQLAASLFSSSGLNLPIEEFITPSGPMWSTFDAASSKDPGSHQNDTICSGNINNGLGAVRAPAPETPTLTTLSVSPSSVLGRDLTLTATVTSNGSPITKDSMYFVLDGTYLPSVPLTPQGTATMTIPGASLKLGSHKIQADYSAVTPYAASETSETSVTVYASAPIITLSTSAESLDGNYGMTSKPVTVQIMSIDGMAGVVKLTCTGLPVGMTCNFNPGQVNLQAGGSSTASLTITANAVTLSSVWIPGNRIAYPSAHFFSFHKWS